MLSNKWQTTQRYLHNLTVASLTVCRYTYLDKKVPTPDNRKLKAKTCVLFHFMVYELNVFCWKASDEADSNYIDD